jgi:lysophospholipase L1-like esterase
MRTRLTLLSVIIGFLYSAPASAVTLGVMGDSLSDEYAEESYGSYAQNWNEQLVNFAGFDLGPTAAAAAQPGGTWGEPRRTGYEFNWARSGATSVTLLSDGQHSGVAAQVIPEGIDYVTIAIGANDYNPADVAYQAIYANLWSQAQIDAHNTTIVANILTALDTALATGVDAVVTNIPDYGLSPTVQGFFPDPVGRQRVADAITQANNDLAPPVFVRGVVLIDFFEASLAIFGPHGSPNATLTIGNVAIQLNQADTAGGGNPTAGFVDDGVHPNTTLQALSANMTMEALNIAYGEGLTLFTEAEILAHRGIAYGGSDTLVAQFGNYSDYIYAPQAVPGLGMGGIVLCAVGMSWVGGRRLQARQTTA